MFKTRQWRRLRLDVRISEISRPENVRQLEARAGVCREGGSDHCSAWCSRTYVYIYMQIHVREHSALQWPDPPSLHTPARASSRLTFSGGLGPEILTSNLRPRHCFVLMFFPFLKKFRNGTDFQIVCFVCEVSSNWLTTPNEVILNPRVFFPFLNFFRNGSPRSWCIMKNAFRFLFPNSGSYRVLVVFQKDFQVQLVPGMRSPRNFRPRTILAPSFETMQVLLHNFKTMQILLHNFLTWKLQEPDFRYTTIQAVCFFLGSSNAKPQQLFKSPMHSEQCRFCYIILKQCRFCYIIFFLANSRNPILGTQRYRLFVFFRLLQCKAPATFQVSNAKPQQLFL